MTDGDDFGSLGELLERARDGETLTIDAVNWMLEASGCKVAGKTAKGRTVWLSPSGVPLPVEADDQGNAKIRDSMHAGEMLLK